MHPVMVSQDIVPLGEFKSGAARFLRQLGENHHPIVITQNGRPAAVLLSPQAFDELQERQRFLESVSAGIADADAGRVIDTEQLRSRLKARRVGERASKK